ncbi:MAG: hypothetical protein APF80_07730 [Alphaproteobacteria bacterium BRH_c36]|nr:MAG: hypothetical protein APF80_07730 [Alphaproteobacteria bacterium BRH_c36]
MATAYLHIGSHKTGTSALQCFIGKHRDWLGEHGLYVPKSGQVKNGAHHQLARALSGLPAPAIFSTIADQFSQELRTCGGQDLLISSESFSMLLRSPDVLDTIVENFSVLGYSITIIYYLRNMPQYYNSAYAQKAKAIRQRLSFQDEINYRINQQQKAPPLPLFLVDPRLEKIVRPYNTNVRRAGIVTAVMNDLGLPPPPRARAAKINKSPGPVTVDLGRWLTRQLHDENIGLTPLQLQACVKAVRELAEEQEEADARYVGLTTETARMIEVALQEKCEMIAEIIWGESWESCFPGELDREYVCNDLELVDAEHVKVSNLRAELSMRVEAIRNDEILSRAPAAPPTIASLLRGDAPDSPSN